MLSGSKLFAILSELFTNVAASKERGTCVLWSGVMERSIGVESDFRVAKVEWTADVMCVSARACMCVCVCY